MKSYRLVLAENSWVSPCPCERWDSILAAERGRRYYESLTGLKLSVKGEL